MTDFEIEVLDETNSAIIQEAETAEDKFSQKQKSEKIYTVTFYADNITVDTQAVKEGGTAEEPEVPQKPG